MAHRHFKSGTGVFACTLCSRKTRMTTQSIEGEYCGECEELLSVQNTLWDDGPQPWMAKLRDKLLAKISKLGGNADAVRTQIGDLLKVNAQ